MGNKHQWSSETHFIAVASGAAVGLGNIWRMPYLVSEYGGGTFLLIYLIFLVIFCLPLMLAEFALGRYCGAPLGQTFKQYFSTHKLCSNIGIFYIFVNLLILSFYLTVTGFTIYYIGQPLLHSYHPEVVGLSHFQNLFENIVSSYSLIIILTLAALFIVSLITYLGLKAVEWLNIIFIPLIIGVSILATILVSVLSDTTLVVNHIFSFDINLLNGNLFAQAAAQALFSLSLCLGVMMVYASYAKPNFNLKRSAASVIFIDTLISLLASIIILSLLHQFNNQVYFGSHLTFSVLPFIFSKLQLGYLSATVFFVILFLAAITSTVAAFHAVSEFFSSLLKVKKQTAIILLVIILAPISIIEGLSIRVLHSNYNIFATTINVSDYLIIIGAIILAVVVGHYADKEDMKHEVIGIGKTSKFTTYNQWFTLLRWIIPVISVVLLFYK